MYPLSVGQWGPFAGCEFDCSYCRRSFQQQAKRQKHRCMDCYNYRPHTHPERLEQRLPRTGYMQFIFCCASGDIAFCPTDYLEKIAGRIRREKDRTFLVQSKDPATFGRIKWPKNVILGTTIETDNIFTKISKAPSVDERWQGLKDIKHPHKMITVEPILDFGNDFWRWLMELEPCMVWIGYDTKKTGLIEPSPEKVKEFHWRLSRAGIPVILKNTDR